MEKYRLNRFLFCALMAFVFLLLGTRSASAQIIVGSNVNVSKRAGNEAEPAVTIDPSNPLRIFVSSNLNTTGLLASRSSDGGAHWTTATIAEGADALPPACCDSSPAFDSFGNLWLTYLGEDQKIKLILSTNGGQSWSNVAGFGNGDEPTVAAAARSVWVTFHDGAGTISATGAPVSGLGTVGSFVPVEVAPGSTDGHYGDIAIGPNGEVLVTYQSPSTGQGPGDIYVNLDPDGLGPSGFNSRIHVTRTNVGGFDYIPAQASRSVDAEAGLAWDRSGGLYNNRIYLVYTDEFPDESNNMDILLRYSDNLGSTWSTPIRVNDDTTLASQFNPRIALDETTGNVAISWYDCRDDSGSGTGDSDGIPNDDAELFATLSSDGGRSVFPNVLVSAGISNAADSSGRYEFGDYEGLAFEAGKFFPVWADNSNSTGDNPDGALYRLDIYTAALQDITGGPGLGLLPASLPGGTLNFYYDQLMSPTGGSAPYSFTPSGGLPPGLTLNCSTSTCALSGTPSASGTFPFSLAVTDSASHSGSRNYVANIATTCTFCDDFEDDVLSPDWTYSLPSWTESGGYLTATAADKTSAIATPAFGGCSGCSVDVPMQSSGGLYNKVWLLAWFQDKHNTVEVIMQVGKNRWVIDQRVNGIVVTKAKGVSTIAPDTVYDVKVSFDGTNFTLSVNGAVLAVLPAAVPPFGTVGFRAKKTTAKFGSILVNP